MASCERIRPLLYRIIEQEAEPVEAIEVANHLGNCTACKILLARKRRLAQMLETELVDLPVGEDFVKSVMATLPDGPPPRPRRRRKRLVIGCGVVTLGLAIWLGVRHAALGAGETAFPALPQLGLEGSDRGLRGLLDLISWVMVALDTLARNAPLRFEPWGGELEFVAPLVAALFAAVLCTPVVALAAGSILCARGPLRPRS